MAKSFTVIYYGDYIQIEPDFLESDEILELDELMEEIEENFNSKDKLEINYLVYLDNETNIVPIDEEEKEILYNELDNLLDEGFIELVDFFEVILDTEDDEIIDTVDI